MAIGNTNGAAADRGGGWGGFTSLKVELNSKRRPKSRGKHVYQSRYVSCRIVGHHYRWQGDLAQGGSVRRSAIFSACYRGQMAKGARVRGKHRGVNGSRQGLVGLV